MRACPKQQQIGFGSLINKQPVGPDVAFTAPCIISDQSMVSELFCKSLLVRQNADYGK